MSSDDIAGLASSYVLSRRAMLLALGSAVTGLTWGRSPAMPSEVGSEIAGARQLGSGTLKWFGFSVYEARLWAGAGFRPGDFDAAPFALEIEYSRQLAGQRIAERSLTEMTRAGAAMSEPQRARWLALMTQAFPDVNAGDRITGVFQPLTGTRFYFNGVLRSETRDADFAERFFGIWLAPHTSEPELRRQLLGTAR
ncbi:hypothetical protein BH11PSE8_BH11PSE8_12140 [soil metagenome]